MICWLGSWEECLCRLAPAKYRIGVWEGNVCLGWDWSLTIGFWVLQIDGASLLLEETNL